MVVVVVVVEAEALIVLTISESDVDKKPMMMMMMMMMTKLNEGKRGKGQIKQKKIGAEAFMIIQSGKFSYIFYIIYEKLLELASE